MAVQMIVSQLIRQRGAPVPVGGQASDTMMPKRCPFFRSTPQTPSGQWLFRDGAALPAGAYGLEVADHGGRDAGLPCETLLRPAPELLGVTKPLPEGRGGDH